MMGLLKFLLGFFLAIAILAGAGVATTRYFMAKLAIPPERPTFASEIEEESPEAEPAATPDAADETTTAPPDPEAQPEATPEPSVAEPEPEALNETPDEGYAAFVSQPIGLILRESPTQESRRIAGLEYNTEVLILGESADGEWVQIRLPGSNVEGWVKSGNTQPLDNPVQ